jgi:hypothetical protein
VEVAEISCWELATMYGKIFNVEVGTNVYSYLRYLFFDFHERSLINAFDNLSFDEHWSSVRLWMEICCRDLQTKNIYFKIINS